MKSDNVIDDVEKVMEKFMLLKSKLEGEFGEIVERAKKVQEAKKDMEEKKEKAEVKDMKVNAKILRRVKK